MAPGSLQNLTTSLQKLTKFNEIYDLVEKNLEVLRKNASSLASLLSQFDLETHSPVHSAILMTMYEPSFPEKSNLISLTSDFLNNLSPNRRLTQWLNIIVSGFVERLIFLKQPINGIKVLIEFIKKLQYSSEQLTVFHSDLLQLSLAAQCFNPVINFLSEDILDLAKYRSIEAKDYLLFFYYLGMIQAAMKHFEDSLQSFDNCLLMPAVLPSKIMIEAAKKQILISLIVHGKHVKGHYGGQISCPSSGFSEYISPWKRYITVYEELINVFKKDDITQLTLFIEMHSTTFIDDGNFGLVKQVREWWIRNRIKNLTKTFITMSLSDLAIKVGLNDSQIAEKYLLEMIDLGEISAKISQLDATVQFLDSQENYDSADMLQKMNWKIGQCVKLEKYLNVVSDNVTTSHAYAKWVCENEARSSNKNPV